MSAEWDEIVTLAQEYCLATKPDTVEIGGFVAWLRWRLGGEKMDCGSAIDLVEERMDKRDT